MILPNIPRSQRLFPLLLLLLIFPQPALAHKIHVFAWVSGNTVTVESNFSEDRPLIKGTVTVLDNKSKVVLLEGKGDEKGLFSFQIPVAARAEALDLLIVVAGGEGHKNHWLLGAEEYLSEASPAPLAPALPTASDPPVSRDASKKAGKIGLSPTEIQQMLEKVLTQELAPIKRSLAKAEERQTSLPDIIGGIGYLLGLAGLIAWLRNRRPDTATRDK